MFSLFPVRAAHVQEYVGTFVILPIPRERRPVHTFTCHYLPQRGAGFGQNLATGWGKPKGPLGCPKLKSTKEAS
jgi:hypothetical protein